MTPTTAQVTLSLDAQQYFAGLNKVQAEAQEAGRRVVRSFEVAQTAGRQMSSTMDLAAGAARTLAGVAATVATGRAFIQTADSVTVLNNQLKLATGSQQAATVAQAALFDIAQRSRVSFTELGGTYAQIARASGELGLSQKQLLTVTEAIGNAMTISGGDAGGMNAALMQLSQGLASGTLRGEELNSVMEQTPRLARALADGLGVPIGKLREMGAAGELTADKVIAALQSQSAVLRDELASSATTSAQAMQQLSNAAVKAVGDLDRVIGATSAWSRLLQGGANDLSVFSQTMELSASRGEGAFMQLANGVGALVGRAGFGALEISASAVNTALNFLTAGVLDLDENVRLMPANLQTSEMAMKAMNARLQDAQKEYDALSERLKSAPDNIYIKSELGNLARYIAALKEAKAQQSALTGAAYTGPVEYGNEGKREASRQADMKRAQDQAKALAEFQKTFATPQQRQAAALSDWRGKLGNQFTPEMQKLIEGEFPATPGGGKAGKAGKPEDPEAEAKRYLDSLQKQLQATRDLSVEETLLADIQAGRLGKVEPEREKELRNIARQIDAAKAQQEMDRLTAKIHEDAEASAERARKEQERLLQSMLDATPTAQLEKQREEMQLLAKAFEDGRITAEQFGEAANTRLGNVAKDVDKANESAKAFGQIMNSAFEVAVINGGKLSDVVKGLIADLARMAPRKSVTEPLAQVASGWIGSFIDGFRADGGPVSAGKTYMVGERGPELFSPATSGFITPNHALSGGGAGAGVVVNQYVTIDARGADASVDQKILAAMRQTKQETLAAVQMRANRGGSFAASVGRA